ncbi:MAG: ATP-binding cassette domain-containing protein [Myxococcota bacterium]
MNAITLGSRAPLLEASKVRIDAPGGRPLFRDLHIRLVQERVGLVGRNGVGKSSLLEVLAGWREPDAGTVRRRATIRLVPQVLPPGEPHRAVLSAGQSRVLHLREAIRAQPALLLLDEPTQDLDGDAVAWLVGRLSCWKGGLLVVSHDRRLLRCFRDFVLVAESGCRPFSGTLAELEVFLEHESTEHQRRYLRNLSVLMERERHNNAVCRSQRKKSVGRLRELARATPRARLNKTGPFREPESSAEAGPGRGHGAERRWQDDVASDHARAGAADDGRGSCAP